MSGVPVSKPVLLIIIGAICAGAFLNGLRFAQMDRNPWEGKKLGGMPVQGHNLSIEQVNRLGKLQMIVAPIFFLVSVAIVSGIFGPVQFR
jgi:hypothetical protein